MRVAPRLGSVRHGRHNLVDRNQGAIDPTVCSLSHIELCVHQKAGRAFRRACPVLCNVCPDACNGEADPFECDTLDEKFCGASVELLGGMAPMSNLCPV
eukprot:gene23595-3364_t